MNEGELDLHAVRQDGFDVDGHPVVFRQSFGLVCQAGEVGGQLYKSSIGFHPPHPAGHGHAGGKPGGVLQPGAQKLLVGEKEPSLVGVAPCEHGIDFLPHGEPAGRVRDAGDGAVFNPDERHHPAPHIHKGAEALQVGHGGGENGARRAAEQFCQSQLLGPAAGEGELGRRALSHPGDGEGDGLSHPGENGDFPGGSLPDAQGGLLPGNGSGEGAQVHQQIVARGAQDGPALQHGFLLHSLAEGGEGLPGGLVFWGVEQAPFWEIQVGHTLPSFLIP